MKNTPLLTQFKESACQCRANTLDGHMFWNPFPSFKELRFPCHKMRAFLQLKTSSPQWRTTSQGLARPAPAQCFKNDNLAWMVSVLRILYGDADTEVKAEDKETFIGPSQVEAAEFTRSRPACCAPRGVSDHSAQPCCIETAFTHLGLNMFIKSLLGPRL